MSRLNYHGLLNIGDVLRIYFDEKSYVEPVYVTDVHSDMFHIIYKDEPVIIYRDICSDWSLVKINQIEDPSAILRPISPNDLTTDE
jgi:hypothetical protein